MGRAPRLLLKAGGVASSNPAGETDANRGPRWALSPERRKEEGRGLSPFPSGPPITPAALPPAPPHTTQDRERQPCPLACQPLGEVAPEAGLTRAAVGTLL